MENGKSNRGIVYTIFGNLTPRSSVLLIIHGRGVSSVQFKNSAPIIGDFITVVVIDLPGHGQSDEPSDWKLASFAEDIHSLMIEDLQVSRFDLFGHSLGAVIALEYVRQHPTRVRKLVVMGAQLEIQSVPPYLLKLDVVLRRVLGNTFLYSWYMMLLWCKGESETRAFMKEVWRSSGGHNAKRDLLIIRQIPRYDYLPDLVEFEEEGGKLCMIICADDTLINKWLSTSIAFLAEEKGRHHESIQGGHYSHSVTIEAFVTALKRLLA